MSNMFTISSLANTSAGGFIFILDNGFSETTNFTSGSCSEVVFTWLMLEDSLEALPL